MTAIKRALEHVRRLEQITTSAQFAIFTDSLMNFDRGLQRSRPNIFADLMDNMHSISSHVTLVWVPSYIGIPGNEKAEKLANKGEMSQNIDYSIDFELQEANERAKALSRDYGNRNGMSEPPDDITTPSSHQS